MQIQLLSVEDKLQCTSTEGWEICLGFQKLSGVLAVLHEAAGVPGGSGGPAGTRPLQHVFCFQISWC